MQNRFSFDDQPESHSRPPSGTCKHAVPELDSFNSKSQDVAMGENPVPPVNIILTKIGSKMGRKFTYPPKWDPIDFEQTRPYSS